MVFADVEVAAGEYDDPVAGVAESRPLLWPADPYVELGAGSVVPINVDGACVEDVGSRCLVDSYVPNPAAPAPAPNAASLPV